MESIVEKLLVDEEVWKLFAKIKATLQKKGKTMSNMDTLIAATAKSYNLILVSNDNNMKNLNSLEGDFNILVMKSLSSAIFSKCKGKERCWGSKGRGLKFSGGFRCRSTHPTLAGQFDETGVLNFYFGYRLADGMVVYSPDSLKITIIE